jgi:threonine dehydratase
VRSFVRHAQSPPALSELTGARIFCKQEHLQRTGSFKERGARNALAKLPAAQARTGVIAASAGNHSLGLAWHGRLLAIPVTVVMPRFAPIVKVAGCRRFGAEVVLAGDTFDEARAEAARLATKHGLTYIHPFDDPDVIAGQGTLGFEILEQVPGCGGTSCAVKRASAGACRAAYSAHSFWRQH